MENKIIHIARDIIKRHARLDITCIRSLNFAVLFSKSVVPLLARDHDCSWDSKIMAGNIRNDIARYLCSK